MFSLRNESDSPYSKDFKCPTKSDEKYLLYKRQLAMNLPRKDLEDKYIDLCDENFCMKRRNNELLNTIQKLTAKIIRQSDHQRSYSIPKFVKGTTIEKRTRRTSIYSNQLAIHTTSPNSVCKESITPNGKNIILTSGISTIDENYPLVLSNEVRAQENNPTAISEQSNSIQNEITKLKAQNEKLKENLDLEKKKNNVIINENRHLKNRLENDLKKVLIENNAVNRLNRKLENFEAKNQKISIEKNIRMEEDRIKNHEITIQLKKERISNNALENKINKSRTAYRTIEMLKKQISELENDKKFLLEHQRSLSILLKTAAISQIDYQNFEEINKNLLDNIALLKAEKTAIENSKNEMFHKIRQLQDFNDQLLVDLEQFRTEENINVETRN